MKKIIFLTFLLILGVSFLWKTDLSPPLSFAQTESQLLKKIEALEKEIVRLNSEGESLGREIKIIENEILLKEALIEQKEAEIDQKEKELEALTEDIRLLEIRLDRLNGTIGQYEDLLELRIKQQYMIGNSSNSLELILAANDMGDLLAQIEYFQRIQAQDQTLIDTMKDTQNNYEKQKDILREKKDQVEEIKNTIEQQKAQAEQLKANLATQKQSKASLLSITKNNEKKYQELLDNAKKELDQIQSAVNVVIREGKAVKVNKGEVIGTMGNSGFSTGAHLHFGIYKYNEEDFEGTTNWGWYYRNYINPLDKLKSKTVLWSTGCYRDPSGNVASGKGEWDWPMDDPRITQSYGSNTCYNWMYKGNPHPALDMVGRGDISVKAAEDGNAYFCRNCLGDGGNGVFIFHDGGYMSVYWHLK